MSSGIGTGTGICIDTRRGGWTTGGTLGSSVIWCSPWNFPTPLKHSGYWAIKSRLLIGEVSFGCSGELVIVCGQMRRWCSVASVYCSWTLTGSDQWMLASLELLDVPGVSVTQNDQGIRAGDSVTTPCWLIRKPPFTVSTTFEGDRALGLTSTFLSIWCGKISR